MTTAQATIVLKHLRRLSGPRTAAPSADAELLERFRTSHDEAAFAELVKRHGPMVLGVCRSVLRHAQDAEDAFQATFLALARRADSVRRPEALAGFLYEVAYRAAIKAKANTARRRAREQEALPMAAAEKVLDMTLRDLQRVLHEELRRLPEKYRLPLVLCYLEGRSHQEAAEQLGLSRTAFRGRLDRGREHLRRRLERRGIAPSALAAADLFTRAPTPQSFSLGAVSKEAQTLADGVLRALSAGKVKLSVALVLAASLLAGAAALGRQAAPAGQTPPAPAQAATAPPAGADEGAAEVRGRVLDPDGKPVPGAKLYFYRLTQEYKDPSSEAATTTADGGFSFRIARLDRPGDARNENGFAGIISATAPGHGAGWARVLRVRDLSGVTVKLVRADIPLEGRVLDLQGKPVPGITVRITAIAAAEDEDLKPWLQKVQKEKELFNVHYPRAILPAAVAGLTQAVTTGADGRFRLTGIGRERLVMLRFEGPGIETHDTTAMTHVGPTVRIAADPKNPAATMHVFYGARFDHAVAPTRSILGTVRDRDTGKPLAGVTVFARASSTFGASSPDYLSAVSDAEGHYRLVGLPRAGKHNLDAVPPPGAPYLPSAARAGADTGFEPVTQNFALKRGVVIRGRVTDKATGKAVRAHVDYFAFADNPHLREAPGFSQTGVARPASRHQETDPDGRFTLVGLPGRGILAAKASENTAARYVLGVGAHEIAGLDKRGLFHTVPFICSALRYQTLAEINPAPGTETVLCDLVLDPGKTVIGSVVDSDGKPLEGVTIEPSWGAAFRAENLPSARFRLPAIDSRHPRPFFFHHVEKSLGAAVLFRGDESMPVTVRLQKCGSLSGRLVDEDGLPRARVRVTGYIQEGQLNITEGWYGFVSAMTDKDGRFRIEGVIPEVRLSLATQDVNAITGRLTTDVELRPGETKDLGDLKAKPLE
jgi:RNA polymerase sigma factor (sigma-70 family)